MHLYLEAFASELFIYTSQQYKRRMLKNSKGKMHSADFSTRLTPSSNPPFVNLVLVPFHISYHFGKAVIFNKNYGNNQEVDNDVSIGLRLSVGRALLSQ